MKSVRRWTYAMVFYLILMVVLSLDAAHGGSTFTVVLDGLKNQDEITELGRVTTYPELTNLRGHAVWITALPYQNRAFPDGADCGEVTTASPALSQVADPEVR